MLICLECGKVFSEDEVATFTESRGEFWGQPCTETMTGCPNCYGDYEEAIRCELCGEYYSPEKSKYYKQCCEDCAEELNKRFIEVLHENFTEYEISVINAIYETREIK